MPTHFEVHSQMSRQAKPPLSLTPKENQNLFHSNFPGRFFCLLDNLQANEMRFYFSSL